MPRKSVTLPGASGQRHVGTALRRLRKNAGYSVRTLAQEMGLSASFLSQVENGLVSPSISSLEKMGRTLGVTLADLFATPSGTHVAIVRGDERPSFTSLWSKARIDALTPLDGARTLEALMVTLEAGGTSGKHPSVAGADQFVMALKGRLTLTHADDEIQFERGDAILIRANTPRRWRNPTRRPAQILIVSARGR